MLYRVLPATKRSKAQHFPKSTSVLWWIDVNTSQNWAGRSQARSLAALRRSRPDTERHTNRWSTTNLSYRFPIFETSATALCGTTGISYLVYSYDSQDDGIGAVVFQTALLDPPLQEQRNNWKTHNPVFPNSLESSVACLKSKLELPSGNVFGWKGCR